jgi:hypothetical protein
MWGWGGGGPHKTLMVALLLALPSLTGYSAIMTNVYEHGFDLINQWTGVR